MANKVAKKALEQFKMQVASEVGVNLNNNGYNGDLTTRQVSSTGSQVVKKNPVRTMRFERKNRIVKGHKTVVGYSFCLIL